MTNDLSIKRLAENEAVYRAENERVYRGTQEFFSAQERARTKLYFYCECADIACKERIHLTPKRYRELHSKDNQFVVVPGHEIDTIETAVKRTPGYLLVEKHIPLGNAPSLYGAT